MTWRGWMIFPIVLMLEIISVMAEWLSYKLIMWADRPKPLPQPDTER